MTFGEKVIPLKIAIPHGNAKLYQLSTQKINFHSKICNPRSSVDQ